MSVFPPPNKPLAPEDIELFRQLEAIFEANPLQAYNLPGAPAPVHHKQLEFNRIKTPPLGTKALIAGNRTGKTRGGLADDVIQAVRPELVPEHLKECKKWEPPFHCWIGAPKYSKHEDTILPTLRKLIPKAELINESFDKSYKSQSRMLRLSSGSTFGLKTYDQDLDAWASAEVNRVHFDEEPNGENSRDIRSEAYARILSTEGDILITMSPLLGMSWVNDEVWEARHDNPKISVVTMGMADNPWLSAQAIKDFEAGLTEEEIRMRVHGEFVHLGGMFFEEFREKLHVVDPITPDHLKGQEIVIGIDPGRNRTGVVWLGFDSDNAAIVFDEFNPKEATVVQVAEVIKERNRAWGLDENAVTYVIDPSARNTSAINADQVSAAYARSEIYCQPGQNSRAAGILEMKRRLQAKDGQDRPHPTLVWARNCVEGIKQAERYRRDPKAADEWAAVAQNDRTRFDLVDATRYALMARTWEFADPSEIVKPPPSYDPVFEPAFDPNDFLIDPAPMGDWS